MLIQESRWKLPHLLQLPENYNTIFQYYHRKTCSVCTKVPKDPAVCLVCGTFVCLKGLCCKQQSYCECVLVSEWPRAIGPVPGTGAVERSALQSVSQAVHSELVKPRLYLRSKTYLKYNSHSLFCPPFNMLRNSLH